MTKKFVIALVSLMVLAFLAVGSASADPYSQNITAGSTLFIGESGLNITNPMNGSFYQKIAWYASGSDIGTDSPAMVYDVPTAAQTDFYVDNGMFGGYTGAWYAYGSPTDVLLAFYVDEPSLSLAVFNTATSKDVTNKKVVADDTVTFRVNSKMYSLFSRPDYSTGTPLGTAGIDIKVKTPDGATLNAVRNQSQGFTSLSGIKPTNQQYFILNNDATADVWQFNISQYSPGTYEVYAECNVNSMKTNLGSLTGKTVSATGTIEVDKDTVTITADKETVIRNNDFTVTIDGKPKTPYYVWFSGTNNYNFGNSTSADSVPDINTIDIPPQFSPNQDDVSYMNNSVADKELQYKFKGTTSIVNDVASDYTTYPDNTSDPYAVVVTTGSDGKATVGIETHQNTKAATYTIRVQKPDGLNQLYDTVKVKVEKGTVTITASGEGTYYLGEEVTFSGTNTDSDYTYLFMTGPNLGNGDDGVKLDDPTTAAVSGDTSTFARATVLTDNTWDFKLETATIGIDAGTYAVYAVNEPKNAGDLSGTKYDTVSIMVKKPYVTATVSSSTVAKGDKLFIRGTAVGNPTQGVGIWILGQNYWKGSETGNMVTETVNDDGSFEYEFGSGDTKTLSGGQYFVVVQHPMYNDQFDVLAVTTSGVTAVEEQVGGDTQNKFIIWGGGNKLQGSEAAEALIQMINSPDIDDTYTKLTFLVEEPWIRINAIGDHYVGDQFTIAGTTNLAIDDDIMVEVRSSSFKPTDKSQSGEFSGQSETVKVVEGATANEWSMDVDASSFQPDEYIVNVKSIETSAATTTTFNILKGTPTVTATATSTGQASVTVTATTTAATPTDTASPGFGALVALIGLGAVAALVLRKE